MHIKYNIPKISPKPKPKPKQDTLDDITIIIKKFPDIKDRKRISKQEYKEILAFQDICVIKKPQKEKRWKGYGTGSNLLNKIEIDVTYDCNMKCVNCNRGCDLFPSNERISIDKVGNFVNDFLSHQHKLDRIIIIGGEPTLHPDILQIIDIIHEYKRVYAECNIHLATNGVSDFSRHIITLMPSWLRIKTNTKKPFPRHYKFYKASKDFNQPAKACYLPWKCGFSLNPHGYYPCAPGATIDRIFNLGVAIKQIDQLNCQNFIKQMQILCEYCGFNPLIRSGTRRREIAHMSPSWKTAYNG